MSAVATAEGPQITPLLVLETPQQIEENRP